MKVPSISPRRGFTLIELLVVISIIAILLTLLFPAADAALESARRVQAKNDATQIAAAVNAYLSEYGKLPIATGGSSSGNINSADLMNTLAGAKADDELNPRQMVFLEVPRAKGGKNGAEDAGDGSYSSAYKDPWTNEYFIYVDDDYDNVIDAPDGLGKIRKTAIVYSKGNPKKSNTYNDSSKWLKSWE